MTLTITVILKNGYAFISITPFISIVFCLIKLSKSCKQTSFNPSQSLPIPLKTCPQTRPSVLFHVNPGSEINLHNLQNPDSE